jgi:hypothetical protein
MTVNTTNITDGPYLGNGISSSFSYTFRIVDKQQLTVYETTDTGFQTLLTVDTNYTVSGIGNDNGGTITLVAGALPVNYKIYIRSNYKNTQLTSFSSQGAFFPELHEDAMDKLTFLVQQDADRVLRSIRLSDSDLSGTLTLLADVDIRKNTALGFDNSGAIQYLTTTNLFVNPSFKNIEATTLSMSLNTKKSYLVGDVVDTIGHHTGTVGGGTYDVVSTISVTPTPNGSTLGINIIKGIANIGISFVLRMSSPPNVLQLGAIGGDETKDQPAILAAFEYLGAKAWPGGFVYFPKVDQPYVMSDMIDTLKILFTKQGMTYPPTLPGDTLPNGEIARNVLWGILGDNSPLTTTASFSDPYVFKFGERDFLTGFGQSSKMVISGMEFIGVGTIGHSDKTIFESKYTALADPNKGTNNTTVSCIGAVNVIPSSYIVNTDIRHFDRGLVASLGFCITYQSGSIQYCNQGVHATQGFTNLKIDKGVEIELCAFGVVLEQADDIVIDAVVEANSCALALYSCKFFECTSWMEGNTIDVVLRTINTVAFNRQIHFNESVGPASLDSNGGLIEFSIRNSPTGSSYIFGTSIGESFENIIFENNDFDTQSKGFDLASISVNGLARIEDIQVKGRVFNQIQINYGARESVRLHGNTSTALPSAARAFDVLVPNMESNARIEIKATKSAPTSADMQIQTMYYVGVISRDLGSAAVAEFSATESLVTTYPSTGANVPITIAVPTSSTVGAIGEQQTLSIKFPTGSAVSGSANTIWDVKLSVLIGDMRLVRA